LASAVHQRDVDDAFALVERELGVQHLQIELEARSTGENAERHRKSADQREPGIL
jgi:hypothetical protein